MSAGRRPAAGEIAGDNIRRQREAGPHELLRYNGSCQRLTIHEYAVAIEDDHGSTDASTGSSGQHANNNADESVMARIEGVRWQAKGRAPPL
jgi:hypothetical protein